MFKYFKEVYKYYLYRRFHITTVHAYNEFGTLKILIESVLGVPLVNLVIENEHVPGIKRRIRVMKERHRATFHDLPFQCTPKILTTHILLNTVNMLKLFPKKGGSLSPMTIMSGDTLNFKKHLRLQLGHYYQVHEEESLNKSQTPRTRGEICLGSSGNLQGGYKFIALNSGKKIVRRNWDFVPIPEMVIAHVNTLGSDQPKLITFKDRHVRLIGDVETPGVGDNSDEGEV